MGMICGSPARPTETNPKNNKVVKSKFYDVFSFCSLFFKNTKYQLNCLEVGKILRGVFTYRGSILPLVCQ